MDICSYILLYICIYCSIPSYYDYFIKFILNIFGASSCRFDFLFNFACQIEQYDGIIAT